VQCGQDGGVRDIRRGWIRVGATPAQDDVGAGCIAGMQPDIITVRVAERQLVVAAGAAPDPHLQSTPCTVDAVGQGPLVTSPGASLRAGAPLQPHQLLRRHGTLRGCGGELLEPLDLARSLAQQRRDAGRCAVTPARRVVDAARVVCRCSGGIENHFHAATHQVIEEHAFRTTRHSVQLTEQQVRLQPQASGFVRCACTFLFQALAPPLDSSRRAATAASACSTSARAGGFRFRPHRSLRERLQQGRHHLGRARLGGHVRLPAGWAAAAAPV
jgi:hypothetical protein